MAPWMAAVNNSIGNIRAAHQRALAAGDLDRALTLATKPCTYWFETIDGEQLKLWVTVDAIDLLWSLRRKHSIQTSIANRRQDAI